MGESSKPPLEMRFDRRVHLECHGPTVTSDAGLLACRESDDVLGLTEIATAVCKRAGEVATSNTSWCSCLSSRCTLVWMSRLSTCGRAPPRGHI